ncbi:uncharacterized protein BJ212DRAFT_1587438 [Suillus subaureus]|uniref:Uncharacterized protein n=1 Tax=Suillus subaureus TaxID=48587 RepID=A0A9P7EBR5_9AGAM|nr:uncharacterized protein BJ212DRAFT_1587438 [Suillus subaureus]KAG1816677.1 hypothetical protein BJ212DRAFT_1587438 [Suillus subaureus]
MACLLTTRWWCNDVTFLGDDTDVARTDECYCGRYPLWVRGSRDFTSSFQNLVQQFQAQHSVTKTDLYRCTFGWSFGLHEFCSDNSPRALPSPATSSLTEKTIQAVMWYRSITPSEGHWAAITGLSSFNRGASCHYEELDLGLSTSPSRKVISIRLYSAGVTKRSSKHGCFDNSIPRLERKAAVGNH